MDKGEWLEIFLATMRSRRPDVPYLEKLAERLYRDFGIYDPERVARVLVKKIRGIAE